MVLAVFIFALIVLILSIIVWSIFYAAIREYKFGEEKPHPFLFFVPTRYRPMLILFSLHALLLIVISSLFIMYAW